MSAHRGVNLLGFLGNMSMPPTIHLFIACRLITDSQFCLDLMQRVCKAGLAIEEALGSAQDIEGAVEENGAITVVQTRPQM